MKLFPLYNLLQSHVPSLLLKYSLPLTSWHLYKLTTHSIEAVVKLLERAKSQVNEIRIIRLKKNDGKSFATVLGGEEGLEDREGLF